jgi:hypothetical protein
MLILSKEGKFFKDNNRVMSNFNPNCKMRSQDEKTVSQGQKLKKQGTKLVFSPKLVLREVSPPVLGLLYLHLDGCSNLILH